MRNIIDLDFYRKFKIILPVRLRTSIKDKSFGTSRTPVKPYRRRRKSNLESETTKKEEKEKG